MMKIVVTGSLGNISKPLTKQLVQAGHAVTVISSKTERITAIEALGAQAAIGTMQDVAFLTETFTGADAIYVMEAMAHSAFFDKTLDYHAAIVAMGSNFKQAIEQSGVKRVVHLSSIGGHTDKGNGMLRFHYAVEQLLAQLPQTVAITSLRPVGFYYNMLGFIPTIKEHGAIFSNYKAAYKEPWVSPLDIAEVAAEEITKEFTGRKVRYIASDELTGDDIASILGEAIGNPGLQWIALPDEHVLNGLLAAGMNEQVAKGLTDMNAARHTGELFVDYDQHKPVLGKVKLKDYAKEFAAAYQR